ncbi:LysR family transcriptional regulator [Tistrella mobilis]|uniref:LysR family transcriptional regulator n=1 Tax=Tistrella mobilis TaxID=171437 RepID=UPI0035592B7B
MPLAQDKQRIQLHDIEATLSVAETGSFRKAAGRMELGQSAVSRRVQRLEDLLGISLFERRPSGAQLTPAGACFALRVRFILDDLHEAAATASAAGAAKNGRLRIGVIASLSRGSLRRVFRNFLNAHENVDIYVMEASRGELLTQLSHRRLDLLVAAGEPDPEIGDGLLLAHEAIFLAVPSEHGWARRDQLRWDDVRDATFIVSALEPGPEIHDYILRRISDLGQKVHVHRHKLGREGIMTLVGLGLGVSLVADHWRGVAYPNVTFVPIGDEGESVPFSITWRPENDNPVLRRFLSLARVEAKRNGALSAPSRTPDPSP